MAYEKDKSHEKSTGRTVSESRGTARRDASEEPARVAETEGSRNTSRLTDPEVKTEECSASFRHDRGRHLSVSTGGIAFAPPYVESVRPKKSVLPPLPCNQMACPSSMARSDVRVKKEEHSETESLSELARKRLEERMSKILEEELSSLRKELERSQREKLEALAKVSALKHTRETVEKELAAALLRSNEYAGLYETEKKKSTRLQAEVRTVRTSLTSLEEENASLRKATQSLTAKLQDQQRNRPGQPDWWKTLDSSKWSESTTSQRVGEASPVKPNSAKLRRGTVMTLEEWKHKYKHIVETRPMRIESGKWQGFNCQHSSWNGSNAYFELDGAGRKAIRLQHSFRLL